MPSHRKLTGVENDLLENIITLSDTVGHVELGGLTRQLREFRLILESPDRHIKDYLTSSNSILEILARPGDPYLGLASRESLTRHLEAANRVWAIALELKAERNEKRTNQTLKEGVASEPIIPASLQPAFVSPSGINSNEPSVTRITYPIKTDTFRELQDAQFLYHLSNTPQSAQPTDQSILSLMRTSSKSDIIEPTNGHNTFEETVRRAYWDQMKDVLSSGNPKLQIDQLKVLYNELSEATSRFFPPKHPLFALFKHPLAPTTCPLETCTQNMRSLAEGLRERCAPVRDDLLITAGQSLDMASATSIAQTAQSLLKISQLMRGDLNDYALQSASEEDARHWVEVQARSKEREVALKISGSREKLEEAWGMYLGAPYNDVNWRLLVRRLLETTSSSAIAVFFPTDAPAAALANQNLVPPQLMLSVDSLVKVQDLMQAILIVALLKSLLPTSRDSAELFTSRVWALIESAITRPTTASSEPNLKLINIQDEVINTYKISCAAGSSSSAQISDEQLRATVSRTLRTEDPAFRLLQKRLVSALETELLHPTSISNVAPAVMRTGHSFGASSGIPFGFQASDPKLHVKGFEGDALDEPMRRLLQSIRRILKWVLFCWGDYVSKE